MVVPASEVEGVHAPKVIHWDDLQQELARLWSLSAALQPAGDRKAHLAARLESTLQVICLPIRVARSLLSIPSKLLGFPCCALCHSMLRGSWRLSCRSSIGKIGFVFPTFEEENPHSQI